MRCRGLLLGLVVALVACNSSERQQPRAACDAENPCPDGFFCNTDLECIALSTDITPDPCATATCDALATCSLSEAGAAVCTCPAGYEDMNGDGSVCADVDECLVMTDACGAHADCTNTPGSYQCACEPGYAGDPKIGCANINECAGPTAVCGPKTVCADEEGDFTCTCQGGFKGDPYDLVKGCENVNECGGSVCGANAVCGDTVGAFTCECSPGFSGDPYDLVKGCGDINECTANTDNCNVNATCTNTTGSFRCACKSGWSGDGVTCNDINECSTNNGGCSSNANCTNTQGGRTCACKGGYDGDGLTCTDVNECSLGTDTCDDAPAARCTNTSGSYTCACPMGYVGDGRTCLPQGDGHVILIGHDFVDETSSRPAARLLVNALTLSGNQPARVGYLVEFAPRGSPQADNPLKLSGIRVDQFLGFGDLRFATNLDVLIVPDQFNAPQGAMFDLGLKLRHQLEEFVYAGGVLVVMDAGKGTSDLLRAAHLMSAVPAGRGMDGGITVASDPVTTGMGNYTVPKTSTFFIIEDGSDGVVAASAVQYGPVVLHKKFHMLADLERAASTIPGASWTALAGATAKTGADLRSHGGLGFTSSGWFRNGESWGGDKPGDRIVAWFRPDSDTYRFELSWGFNGRSASVFVADSKEAPFAGLVDFSTGGYSVHGRGEIRPVRGRWYKVEARYQVGYVRVRLYEETAVLTQVAEMQVKAVTAGPVTVSARNVAADAIFVNAESR